MTTKEGTTTEDAAVLESAQEYAVCGNFSEAIAILEKYLLVHGNENDCKRLLANVYELRALGEFEYKQRRLSSSPDFQRAQSLLEELLTQSPEDLLSLCDLGDHFLNLGAIDQAVVYYSQAAILLERDSGVRGSHSDDISDALAKIADTMSCTSGRELALLKQIHARFIGTLRGSA